MHQPTGSILRQAGRQVQQWARYALLALPLAAGLASEASAVMTGQVLVVDGGMTIAI